MGVEPTTRLAKSRINGFEGHEDHRTPFASIRGKGIRVRGLRNRRNLARFRVCSDAGVDFGWGRQAAATAVGIDPSRRRFADQTRRAYWFGRIIWLKPTVFTSRNIGVRGGSKLGVRKSESKL